MILPHACTMSCESYGVVVQTHIHICLFRRMRAWTSLFRNLFTTSVFQIFLGHTIVIGSIMIVAEAVRKTSFTSSLPFAIFCDSESSDNVFVVFLVVDTWQTTNGKNKVIKGVCQNFIVSPLPIKNGDHYWWFGVWDTRYTNQLVHPPQKNFTIRFPPFR